MLKNFIRYSIEEPVEYEEKKPYYILKGDGVYLHRNEGVVLTKRKTIDFGDKTVPGLTKGEEGIQYNLEEKVPFKYWLMILDFYKEVYEQDSTEAAVHIYYNKTGEELNIPEELLPNKVGLLEEGNWLIYCPQQVNASTLTEFAEDGLYQWLHENTTCVVETHSHHIMDAFWSSTDIQNQQDPIYYGVYGLLGKEDKYIMKYVYDGNIVDVPVGDVFEFPKVKITSTVEEVDGYEGLIDTEDTVRYEDYKGVFNVMCGEFPAVWLEKCHTTRRGGGVSYGG